MPNFEKSDTKVREGGIEKVNGYKSTFIPSHKALEVLQKGRIIADDESAQRMIERVVDTLVDVEEKFGTSQEEIDALKQEFGALLDEKFCVMSTPVLTNAGRYLDKPLSACTVPKLDFVHPDLHRIQEIVTEIHQEGMGTGFSLDETQDPVGLLAFLNQVANESATSGKEDRPVGNMATLSVYHPKILDFIQAKVSQNDGKDVVWKFNISVDCDENFFDSLAKDEDIILTDGTTIKATEIFSLLTKAAYQCADPGLIFLDKMEHDNPTPGAGKYVSTAPCAEVGLAEGESCQFGYINLGKFVSTDNTIDIEKLKKATRVMTRMLDNALEISIDNYSEVSSSQIMTAKRKIGVGICGLADLFIRQGVPYGSPEARTLALDLITLINFESKMASHELAVTRGSCGAMNLVVGNKYFDEPSFLTSKYGQLVTKYVQPDDWNKLANTIKETRLLRNVSTIALPPTGRSALVIDASTGVEPVFSRNDYHVKLLMTENPDLGISFQTATELSPEEHLLMAASLQRGIDESISKTVNLPENVSIDIVEDLYLKARQLGLKGISIYRDTSKNTQPRKLA